MAETKRPEQETRPEQQVAELIAGSADAAPPAAPAGRTYRTTALVIATGLFMQNLDATVLATALPTLSREFMVSPTSISLALTSYLLALAIFIPASGTIADRFGPRRIFQFAIGLFVAGSIACGFSTDLTSLVVARFVQGIGGAMMVPVGRLVLLRTVEKRDLVAAVAWLAMPAMIGPILGPPLGGFFVTFLDWRWIFWINVPMGALGIFLVGRLIPDIQSPAPPRFDRLGFILSGLALGATLFGLEIVTRPGEAAIGWPLLAIGFTGGIAYYLHARRRDRPILDLALLRVKTFRLTVIVGTLMRISQGALPFLLPMMMQLSFGLSAAMSGAITVMTAIGAFAMKSVVRPVLRRFGFRTSLIAIGLLAPSTFALIGLFRPEWPWPAMLAVLFVYGFLTSLQFSALNTLAYDEIEQERMSSATSFYSTFQQLALSLGVCAAAGFLGLGMSINGHAEPQFADFSIAIWSVVAISLTAIFFNLQFDRNAGAEMAGRTSTERG